MICPLKVLFLSFCVIAVSALSARAQETKTVTAEGVAVIQGNTRDIACDAAIEDAQKRAVEQTIGILIDSQTHVENYQLISDKILSQTKGYITRYNVTGENQDSGLLRVRITADVALSKLCDDLSAIGILMSQVHREVIGTRQVAITITGLSKAQFVKFKDVLKNQVRNVRDLHERSFNGTTARISVDSKVSVQTLSGDLSLRDFGTFAVEVVGSTANSLELRVAPKK